MSQENFHILIVDDNEDILFMLKAMFQFKGYNVSIRDNADDIEYYIKKLSPDVILMDMLLSGANGAELCKKLKADPELSSIPIVMISAMPQAEKICLGAGADQFVGKPFEMEHVINAVAGVLKKK